MSSEDTSSSYDDSESSTPAGGFSADTYGSKGAVADEGNMSVIGPTLVIKGELEAGENLVIQGRVEGTITHNAESLVIGERGTVQANIKARNVVIEGTVDGDIYGSESVSIRETAKVKGNVFTPTISITEGAHFKGGIDMDVRPDNAKKH